MIQTETDDSSKRVLDTSEFVLGSREPRAHLVKSINAQEECLKEENEHRKKMTEKYLRKVNQEMQTMPQLYRPYPHPPK